MRTRRLNRNGLAKQDYRIGVMVFFGILSFAGILVLAVVLATRDVSNEEEPIFSVTQTQRVLLGSDEMLNAGDVIEIRTILSNNDPLTPFNNITLTNFIETGTICSSDGLTNFVAFLNPQGDVECFGIYIMTQSNIDDGSFALSSIASFTYPNGTIFNTTTSSFSDLRQTTFGQLSVNQMYTFDVADPGFLDVDDLLRVTVEIMNIGTETLLDVESTNFNGVLVSELLPMEFVSFTYIINLTLVDFDLTFVLLNETSTGIGRTSAQPVNDNSVLIVNSTRVQSQILRTTTTLMQTTTCAQLGNTAIIEVLLENTGTAEATNVQVTTSLIGAGLICGPMGTNNMVSNLLPGQSISCNGGYMLTGADLRLGYDTHLDTTTTAVASNFPQPFTEPIVNFAYAGITSLYFNTVDNFVNCSSGLSLLDFTIGATRISSISSPAAGCRSIYYRPRHTNTPGQRATFSNFRLNLTKHEFLVIGFGILGSGNIIMDTTPPNLFSNWTLTTSYAGRPGSATFDTTTGQITRLGRINAFLFIYNLPEIETIGINYIGGDPRVAQDIEIFEVVDTTIQ